MRVLHLHSGNLYGGVESLLIALATQNSTRLENVVAVCFEGRLSAELRQRRVEVHRLPAVRLSRPDSVLRARKALRDLLTELSCEVVICHSVWAMAVFGRAVRSARKPLLLWVHDVWEGSHWLQRLASRRRPDLAICNSNFTAESVDRVYPGLPREVLYCPVPAPTRRPDPSVREEIGTPLEALVIVQVSRMEEWKGHELHLRALALLRDLPQWECWMVGGAQRPQEDAYERRLRELTAELGIAERVRFLGLRPDVPRLLTATDIFCQPNTSPEPFGISIVEALYSGLPVVSTGMGGAGEILDGGYGLVVPPRPQAIAGGLRSLLEDPELRASLSDRGPSRALELCDPRRQAERLHELLRRVQKRFPAAFTA